MSLTPISTIDAQVPREKIISLELVRTWAKNHKITYKDLHIAYNSGKKYNIDPLLILSVIAVESSFKAAVKSTAGAIGYMQIVPKWHKEKVSDTALLYDPEYNVRVGTQILREYLDRYGSIDRALQKYSGNTKGYAKKVNRFYFALQKGNTDA